MLPFSIMNQYGNIIAPPLHITKMTTSSTHKALLYANGELYTNGDGSNYKLGTGSTTTDYLNWYKTITGVENVWVSVNNTLVKKTDGTYWHVGQKNSVYGVTGTNTVWTDCTSLFTPLLSSGARTITNICVGSTATLALLDNGDLYGIGRQSVSELGLGNTTAQTAFVLCNTQVQYMSLTVSSSLIIKNNVLMVTGSNSQNQLGIVSTTTVSSWTAVTISGYTPYQVQTSQSDTFLLATNNSTSVVGYFHAGYNNVGVAGGGTTQTGQHTTFTRITALDGLVTSVLNYGIGVNLFGMYFGTSVRSAGWNYQGATGQNNTSQQIRTYEVSVGLPLGNVQFICSYSSSNTFVVVNDLVYVAGLATQGSGSSTNDYTFVKLSTPY